MKFCFFKLIENKNMLNRFLALLSQATVDQIINTFNRCNKKIEGEKLFYYEIYLYSKKITEAFQILYSFFFYNKIIQI